MKQKEAIILAGGFGKRLQSVVSDRPKPMALINGKPFLEYQLVYLSKYNYTHIVLSVGYKYEVITSYFGYEFMGISLTYSIEEKPLGTGGGIMYALTQCTSPQVLVLNGDSFFNVDLNALESFHTRYNADLTLSLKHMKNFSRYGVVELNEFKVIQFLEKQEVDEGLINGGVYILNVQTFIASNKEKSFSFEKDFMNKNLMKLNILGFKSEGYFIDIGLPETYMQAQSDFKKLFA